VISYLTPLIPRLLKLGGQALSFKGEGEDRKEGLTPLLNTPIRGF